MDLDQEDPSDPIDWTVDQVVNFLCHNPATPWSQSRAKPPRPDPTTFENAIRFNEITGEVLLHHVDKDALREDLGLKALGHRSSMLMSIAYLRRISSSYGQASNHVEDNKSMITSPILPTCLPLVETPLAPQTSSPAPVRHTAKGNIPAKIILPASLQQESDKSLSQVASKHNVSELGGVRSHEHSVIDDRGRKRRRLDISSLNQNGSMVPDRGLAPSAAASHTRAKSWYMGPNRLTPSKLFYPLDSNEEDDSFVMLGSEFPPAQRSYVKKCLHYFFKQEPIAISPDEQAVIPYKSAEEFTLFTARKGKVIVSQEELSKWPQLAQSIASHQDMSSSQTDGYTRLLQKYPPQDDEGYPVYGDSGSEGGFDDETWREMENDKDTGVIPAKLSTADIDSTITQCITEFEKTWHRDRKPKEEQKAWSLWQSARKGKCTNLRIMGISDDIKHLANRLEKFTKAIRDSDFWSRADLESQCQSLEHTVYNIQKQKWIVSVLERETCPPQVASEPRPRPLPKPKRQTDADEESLDSESDLDDFIVDDSGTGETDPTRETSTVPPSESDATEEDIVSPSGMRLKSRAQRRAPLRTSSASATGSPSDSPSDGDAMEIIDLTLDSPPSDEMDVDTPPLNPVPHLGSLPPDSHVKLEPDALPPSLLLTPGGSAIADSVDKRSAKSPKEKNKRPAGNFDSIVNVTWEELEELKDRHRLLVKLISSLPTKERKHLAKTIPSYEPHELRDFIVKALNGLLDSQTAVNGIEEAESQLIMRSASIFISWVNCVRLPLEGIRRGLVLNAQNEISGFQEFFDDICAYLATYSAWDRSRREANEGPLSDEPDTPHKKRKKAVQVHESQEAKTNQKSAQQRVALQNEQKEQLERKLESMGLGNNNPHVQAVTFVEPAIYLDSHIGGRIKPHQLKGIQFMWREILQDNNKQGCLLAHTMGLGKTMQVISLLNTISAAASSMNTQIHEQVPRQFKRLQALIICPSSLIDNWFEEFLMWTPQPNSLGTVRKITSSQHSLERLDTAANWNSEGGVLIMSYDIFRNWVLNRETRSRGRPLSDSVHARIKQYLLSGSNIVVADEAHKMKNQGSGIAEAAYQLRTKSRIALTGSPLANNLEDYFRMVDWIAEGYLGEFEEFKANYIEPIEWGLYADSTYPERRRSLVKLKVLKDILEPKINRADISVLAGSLPPKVEFVLTVPLTQLQESAYNLFVNMVIAGSADFTSARLWAWLGILGLCCNHPACFEAKLRNKANDISKKNSEIEPMPGDESIDDASLPDSDNLINTLLRLFDTIKDRKITDIMFSARSIILDRIIDESLKVGDKVLVFSHSIPTLDYIEHMLKEGNRRYCRLDGQTPISNRQSDTKDFNASTEGAVYLISTRAGGLGLNIPGANRVVIYDFGFNPVWEEQAVGRAYRLGQQKPVFVYRFIAGGTFEEVMHNKTVFKTQLASRVVDKKNPIRWAQRNIRDYLFTVKPFGQSEISEYIGKDPHVLDKILESDKGTTRTLVRKIALTETFQREDKENLTEEERKTAEDELDDERLKRTDPVAYQKRVRARELELLQAQTQPTEAPVARPVMQKPRPATPAPAQGQMIRAASESRPSQPARPAQQTNAPATPVPAQGQVVRAASEARPSQPARPAQQNNAPATPVPAQGQMIRAASESRPAQQTNAAATPAPTAHSTPKKAGPPPFGLDGAYSPTRSPENEKGRKTSCRTQ